MSNPTNQLDPLQEKLMRAKFSNLFQRICDVYNTPSATQDLVNHGIATKIAREYNPLAGYYNSERDEIARQLSEINFTAFFSSARGTNSKDKKIYFLFKSPKTFLTSKSANTQNYIRYVLKKYCSVATSERLSEIYYSCLPQKLTKTQEELKKAIYDVVSARATITNRLASIFESEDNKREIKISQQIKDAIIKAKFGVAQDKDFNDDDSPELSLMKSVCVPKKAEFTNV